MGYPLQSSWAFLVAQTVKNRPAVQEASVASLGWQDPLEESMVTHSSILAWRILWTEEPDGLYSPGGGKELDITEVTQYVRTLYPLFCLVLFSTRA